jgi:hypothetical protein
VGRLLPTARPTRLRVGLLSHHYFFDMLDSDPADDLAAMAVDRGGRIVVVGSVRVAAPDIRDFGVARPPPQALTPLFRATARPLSRSTLEPHGSRSPVAIDRLGRIVVAGSTKTGRHRLRFRDRVAPRRRRMRPSAATDVALGFDFGNLRRSRLRGRCAARQPDCRWPGRLPDGGLWIWVVARLTESSTPQPLDLSFGSGLPCLGTSHAELEYCLRR